MEAVAYFMFRCILNLFFLCKMTERGRPVLILKWGKWNDVNFLISNTHSNFTALGILHQN